MSDAYQVVTASKTLNDSLSYETWTVSAPEGTVPIAAGIRTTSLGAHPGAYAELWDSYPDGCDWKFVTLGSGNWTLTVDLYLVCLKVYDVTPVECES